MIKSYKRVALDLHSLNPADQQWLLNKMPVQYRSQLSNLLTELDQLGIPRESTLLEEIANERVVAEPEIVSDSATPYALQLRKADGQKVAKVLSSEPDFLVAALLKLDNWPWQQAVLDSLHETKQRGIAESPKSNSAPVKGRTAEALCRSVVERIDAMSTVPDTNPAAEQFTVGMSRFWPKNKWLPWRK